VSVVCTQAHVFKLNVLSLASLQFHYVQNNIATRLYRMNPSPIMTDGIYKAHNLVIAVYFSAHTANMRVRISVIKFTHRELAILISAIETALSFHGYKGIALFLNIVPARFSSNQSSSLPELTQSPSHEYAGIYAIVTLVSFLEVPLLCAEFNANELARSNVSTAITRAIVSKECGVNIAPIDGDTEDCITPYKQGEEEEKINKTSISQARCVFYF
jgi:hypothetical protein